MRFLLLGSTLIVASATLPFVEMGERPQGQPVEPIDVSLLDAPDGEPVLQTASTLAITTPRPTASTDEVGDNAEAETPVAVSLQTDIPDTETAVETSLSGNGSVVSADEPGEERELGDKPRSRAIFAALGDAVTFRGFGAGLAVIDTAAGPLPDAMPGETPDLGADEPFFTTLPDAEIDLDSGAVDETVNETVAEAPSPNPAPAPEIATPPRSGGGTVITALNSEDGFTFTSEAGGDRGLAPLRETGSALQMTASAGDTLIAAAPPSVVENSGATAASQPAGDTTTSEATANLDTPEANGDSTILRVDALYLNMRDGPSQGAAIIPGLSRGDNVEWLENGADGWVQVRLMEDGRTGWVFGAFLEAASGA
ncbi:MAG: SH3 domain-containing protein [Pseudomonadota bacterium]